MEKYAIQKSQKIVSALYLITDSIKDSDAIKWEIREEGISLVSSVLVLNSVYPIEQEHAKKTFVSSANRIITFLNISQHSTLISRMNASIVIHEIESLISFVEKEGKENHPPGYILSDSFFETDKDDKSDKGHLDVSRTGSVTSVVASANKNSRKDSIINLLKKDSNLTIKDFAKVIKDCSEKTIQRDLIDLVKKGVVKRVGERRWSTYSLI